MSYECVRLDEKMIAGVSARTSNQDPRMGEIIGGLWQKLFTLPPLPGRIGGNTYGVYSSYDNGTAGAYTVTAGVEVEAVSDCSAQTLLRIPAGDYAMFSAPGGPEAAAGLWREIWSAPLDRAFTCDFEEYLAGPDGTPAEIRIYIALRE